MLIDSVMKYIKPEMVGELKRHLNVAANFFKHADHDSNEILTFNPSQSDFFLFDACCKYKDLTGELVPTLGVYYVWFFLGPGAGFVDTTQFKPVDQVRRAFPGSTRTSFFQEALPMISTFSF